MAITYPCRDLPDKYFTRATRARLLYFEGGYFQYYWFKAPLMPFLSARRARTVRACLALTSLAILAAELPAAWAQSEPGQSRSRWGSLTAIGPDTIADIAAAVAPSVVNISVTTPTNAESRRRLRGDRPRGRFDDEEIPGDYLKVTGSGVIVRPDGYILTSLHVVENPLKITVTLQDGHSVDGVVHARDRFSDLALIKIPADRLPVIKFGDANNLRPGDWVIAIGNQFGFGHTVTHGLISGLSREAKAFGKSFGAKTGAVKFIQTDAPINPGSSGGPLINLKGEVIGINTFIRDDAQNIGFAVPANIARETADKLVSSNTIAHPYIGIEMREPSEELPDAQSDLSGVKVTRVSPASPAASAGIEPGDLIVAIDESSVRRPEQISTAVGKHQVGDKLTFKVMRGGSEKVVVVTIKSLPEVPE